MRTWRFLGNHSRLSWRSGRSGRTVLHIRAATLRLQDAAWCNGGLGGRPRGLERIVARTANRLLLLDPADICFLWIDTGIVRAQTVEESYWANYAMGDLEAVLAEKSFFRAHRAFPVNLNRVAEIRPDVRCSFQLVMEDRTRTTIDVGERQGRTLRALIPVCRSDPMRDFR